MTKNEVSQKELMLRGELYDPSDAELEQMRIRARILTRKYNATDETEHETLSLILAELLPHGGNGVSMQAPVYFDYGAFTFFGERCAANFNFTALDCCPIYIGDDVMFGPNCTLAAPMHPLCFEERNIRKREDGSLYNLEYAKPITIGKNCWIAANVVICGGVTIGEGCVIGAGSVVTRDIPAGSFAAGNPCRVIRQITDRDKILPKAAR